MAGRAAGVIATLLMLLLAAAPAPTCADDGVSRPLC